MCCRRYPTKACGWSNPAVRSPWDNVASLLWSGDLFAKSGRNCQHQGKNTPKVLTGLDQNGTGPVQGLATLLPQLQRSPAKRRRPPHPVVIRAERGNPVALLGSIQDSTSQEVPMGRRRKEGGTSEGRSVMERIGSAPSGNILPRESGQTSTRSLVTRELDQPIKEVSR